MQTSWCVPMDYLPYPPIPLLSLSPNLQCPKYSPITCYWHLTMRTFALWSTFIQKYVHANFICICFVVHMWRHMGFYMKYTECKTRFKQVSRYVFFSYYCFKRIIPSSSEITSAYIIFAMVDWFRYQHSFPYSIVLKVSQQLRFK